VAPNLPGFIQTINPGINVGNAIHIFDISWLLGFTLSFITYAVINKIWPARETFVSQAILPDDIYLQESPNLSESPEDDSEEKRSIDSTTFAV
jgi:NCS1 family nucleobase:cation symporter-1